jgi:hypothetical protein
MPSQICNRDGTKLISPAGGTVDLKYHDYRDSSGQPNIFGPKATTSSKTTQPTTKTTQPAKTTEPETVKLPGSTAKVSSKTYTLPDLGKVKHVVLTGKIPNYKQGTKITFNLTNPDDKSSTFYAFATKQGNYKALFTLKHNSPTGNYSVDINYLKSDVGKISFTVNPKIIKK